MARRLAAILVADVVGYSRLMGEDEAGTLAALRTQEGEVLEPSLREHEGRIVKRLGDGLLAEFSSAVEAVQCAAEIQRSVQNRNADIPEGRRIVYRIGINIGDIISDGDDIYGDGVNVAARLEPLAEPGGVCLSSAVFEQVRGKTDHAFRDLGLQKMKNIAQPVRAYALDPETPAQGAHVTRANGETASAPIGQRPSIAVLPFKHFSGDPDEDYFADGISEDIITALSRNRWLTVIARNSSFTYRGEAIDLRQVGRQLGVRYVLDGSVRKGGERIRIAAQLVDAGSGKQIWAERYDRVLEDIFRVQDDVTEAIGAAIAPALGKAEQQRATSRALDNPTVWELYHRGMWHLYQRTKDDLAEARRQFEAALAIERGLSPACSALVDAYYYEVVLGLADSPEENREQALRAARRAVALDPDDAAAHCAMGKARIVRREHALAVPDLQLAIDLNPSLAWAHYGLGAAAVFSGRADEAIVHLERAIHLSPRDQHMGSFMVRLAEALLVSRNYAGAVTWARKALQQQGFQWSRYSALLAALGFLGETEEARRALTECLAQRPDFSVSLVRDGHLFTDQPAMALYLEGLRLAGVPD